MKMQCINCGGEYEASQKQCPFCGTENKTVATLEMKNILSSYDTAAAEMEKTVPQKHLKKWSKKMRLFTIAVCSIIVLLAVFAVLKGKLDSAATASADAKQVAKLEAFLEQKDFEGMREYLRKKELYGYTYDKYWEISDVNENLLRCREMVEDFMKYRDSLANLCDEEYTQYLNTCIDNIWFYGNRAYRKGNEAVNDTNFLDNETQIKTLLAEMDTYLKDAGFSEEAVEALNSGEEEQKEQCEELLRRSWQRQ